MKEKYLLMRDRQTMMSPAYWNIIVQTNPKIEKIYGYNVKKIWMINSNGRHKSIYFKKEFEDAGRHIAKKIYKDKKFFVKLEKRYAFGRKRVMNFISKLKKEDYQKTNTPELFHLIERIMEAWKWDFWFIPAWFLGGDEFKRLTQHRIKLPENDLIFLTNPGKSHISQFRYEYLKTLEKIWKKNKNISFEAEKLSSKYGCIPFGYDGPEFWDKNYFIRHLTQDKEAKKELAEEIKIIKENDKKNKAKWISFVKKYQLGRRDLRLIGILGTLIFWADDRKYIDHQLNYFYSKILHELEKRFSIPYKNLKYLFVEELKGIIRNREKMFKISNERINKIFVIEGKKGETRILPENQAQKILKEIEVQKGGIKIIKGVVACRGEKDRYIGTAKIILRSRDDGKVKSRDFLVTNMTSPDFLVAMKKASAIITDEGGITCHAAIVAREMNKPCIVGTKIATEVLRDGDLVEIDANRGVVRILERAKKKR